MFRTRTAGISLVAFLIFAGPHIGSVRAEESPRYPRLHEALYELVGARKEMKDARGDFGGHRKKALTAIGDAIDSLRALLDVKGDFRGVNRKPEFYKSFKDHPRVRQALVDLREARKELRNSTTDFGGKKKNALRDIDRAIEQVQLAIPDTPKRD